MTTCRTLAYLECPRDGKVLTASGVCPQCRQQLHQLKPIEGTHSINGKTRKNSNRLRGLSRI